MKKEILILFLVMIIAVLLASCERKDPNRNYYEPGTVLERNVVFVFLDRDELDEVCGTDIEYQGKVFPYALACASEKGSPRFVYLRERENTCNETMCLKDRAYRVIRMTILDEDSNFCQTEPDVIDHSSSRPLCYKGNMLYTYQFNPVNDRQMHLTGLVLAEMMGFPGMFNEAYILGHEIYSHTFNMGGTH